MKNIIKNEKLNYSATDSLMSKKEKNKQEDIKSLTHVTLVDENGKRIQPRWIKELEKLSPVRKMILKMKFEEINRKFEIRYNKKIN